MDTVKLTSSNFDSRVKFFVVKREPGRTLGSLRNLDIEMAQGEYVCQWDDDDWYHAGRIEY
jgi:glycosyltransferase involved in cell wall biosynthesis